MNASNEVNKAASYVTLGLSKVWNGVRIGVTYPMFATGAGMTMAGLAIMDNAVKANDAMKEQVRDMEKMSEDLWYKGHQVDNLPVKV